MLNVMRPPNRPYIGYWFGSRLALGLAMVAAGLSGPGSGDGAALAQAPGSCALVTTAEVQPLAPPDTSIASGVPTSLDAAGFSACRYSWGSGTGRFNLDVTVNDAARMFSGQGRDAIKQGLAGLVTAGTADTLISDVGDAAVFKADSALYVHATTYVKGRILQLSLDGFEARDKKDQVIALMKSAASRL